MISIRYVFNPILVLLIYSCTGRVFDESYSDVYFEQNTNDTNQSSIATVNTSSISSSTTSTDFVSTLSPTGSVIHIEKGSMDSVIDQLNMYRYSNIISHIKQCDSNMKLKDLCESYSFNYDNNSLIHQTVEHFQILEDIFDELVNRTNVQTLKELCFFRNTCREHISEHDIQHSLGTIQTYGNAFCSLEQCRFRLVMFLESCPALMNTHVDFMTLNLLPMLCFLHNEPHTYTSPGCQKEIVYLFHILYALGTQVLTCYQNLSTSSDYCTTECQIVNQVLNNLTNECDDHALFLSQLPILSRYQSMNIEEICAEKNISTNSRFIYFVEKYIRQRNFWHQFYSKPIYIIFSMILVIFLLICFSLCCYIKSKFRSKSMNRRFENGYDYARLHDTSFELGNHSEIANDDSMTNENIDEEESEINTTDRIRSPEYQRLLFVNSQK